MPHTLNSAGFSWFQKIPATCLLPSAKNCKAAEGRRLEFILNVSSSRLDTFGIFSSLHSPEAEMQNFNTKSPTGFPSCHIATPI